MMEDIYRNYKFIILIHLKKNNDEDINDRIYPIPYINNNLAQLLLENLNDPDNK